LTATLTVPVRSGAMQDDTPAGALHVVTTPPTLTFTVAGAVRNDRASTVLRAGLPPRQDISLVWA
jgi:hypothetical protein